MYLPHLLWTSRNFQVSITLLHCYKLYIYIISGARAPVANGWNNFFDLLQLLSSLSMKHSGHWIEYKFMKILINLHACINRGHWNCWAFSKRCCHILKKGQSTPEKKIEKKIKASNFNLANSWYSDCHQACSVQMQGLLHANPINSSFWQHLASSMLFFTKTSCNTNEITHRNSKNIKIFCRISLLNTG